MYFVQLNPDTLKYESVGNGHVLQEGMNYDTARRNLDRILGQLRANKIKAGLTRLVSGTALDPKSHEARVQALAA